MTLQMSLFLLFSQELKEEDGLTVMPVCADDDLGRMLSLL